jgi:hypothetical protein
MNICEHLSGVELPGKNGQRIWLVVFITELVFKVDG